MTEINFANVEALRERMLISRKDMAELIGVSRVTYYGWINGRQPRKTNAETIRQVMRKMVVLLRDHGWPNREVIYMEPADRLAKLVQVMNEL